VKESPADVDTVYAKYTEYLAYGFASLGSQSLNQAYRFTGKELDQEGGVNQYYFGSRYYNTEGRWLAVDPQHSKYYGWSPYNYSLCNPISNYDPNGEWVVRALKTAYKVGKRVYNAAKSGKSLRKFDTWKKAGIDEFYDIVDNAKTLIDGDLNADDAFAAIDLVTGFGGEAKKLSKSLGL